MRNTCLVECLARIANIKARYIVIVRRSRNVTTSVEALVSCEASIYAIQVLSKLFWCWLGTEPYWGIDHDDYNNMPEELAEHIDPWKLKSHLTKRTKLTAEDIRKGDELNRVKKRD